jgi:DNA-binding MarR family transcriptional regulator
MTSGGVLPELMVQLFDRIRGELSADALGELRISHVRVVSGVPHSDSGDGISVTELAAEIGMTKQGCGQFVTQLEASGHLVTSPDPADRRVRVVRRTRKGERFLERVYDELVRMEGRFAAQVGERRFAAFKKVMGELARQSP